MMTYFHPRDFDVNQPKIPNLDLSSRFRAYYGIKNCYDKLKKLTTEFNFTDIRSAEKMINWNRVEKIRVK